MKIDMHCHTKEGSLDAKISIEDYIRILREKGFGGILVTDHDTYGGYRYWKKHIKDQRYKDFLVLKGIEYDTLDAGHIIVIMPETIKLRLLELRGIPIQMLIPIVHNYGGILGPAHPCGEKYMSFMNAKAYQRNPDILKEFDFIETFNACENLEVNGRAAKIAEKYNLTGTGGSDAHRADCVGKAYTEVPDTITCESDLITEIIKGTKFDCGGEIYNKTTKDKIGKANTVLVHSFWVYNKIGGWSKAFKRNVKLKEGYVEHVENPIRQLRDRKTDQPKTKKEAVDKTTGNGDKDKDE